jgi:hypothetical protein
MSEYSGGDAGERKMQVRSLHDGVNCPATRRVA